MTYYINPPPQGPLARIIAAIIAVFLLAGALMIGMAALLVLVGVGVVVGLAIWLRVLWIKRQLRKSGINLGGDNAAAKPQASGHIIDAEYTVVSGSKDEQDQ